MPIVGDRRNPYPPPAEVLYFLIHDEERREKGYTFLSPLGELYFLMTSSSLLRLMTQFPSPLGELYFLIVWVKFGESWCQVSVPSRGAIFLNWQYAWMLEYNGHRVSVPSRGAIFLNTMLKGLFALVLAGFRPLSGSYIS